jgi:hypothetical protein
MVTKNKPENVTCESQHSLVDCELDLMNARTTTALEVVVGALLFLGLALLAATIS